MSTAWGFAGLGELLLLLRMWMLMWMMGERVPWMGLDHWGRRMEIRMLSLRGEDLPGWWLGLAVVVGEGLE